MPMKLYKTRDEIPEAHRAAAIETADHQFAVDEPADPALGDAGKKALDAERARADEAERLRKAAETKLADIDRKLKAKDKGVTEEELDRIRQEEEAARRPIIEERDRLAAENQKLKLDDRIRALYLSDKFGGMADRVEDAMDQLKKRTELGSSGGIVFKDKDGNVTADTPETFFPKFKAEKKWLFKGSGASGSGAGGSSADEEVEPVPDGKTPQQQIAEKRAALSAAF